MIIRIMRLSTMMSLPAGMRKEPSVSNIPYMRPATMDPNTLPSPPRITMTNAAVKTLH